MIRKEMKYTDKQGVALDALTEATGETYAEMVRRLVSEEATTHGIEFPQNMPTKQETLQEARKRRWTKEGDS